MGRLVWGVLSVAELESGLFRAHLFGMLTEFEYAIAATVRKNWQRNPDNLIRMFDPPYQLKLRERLWRQKEDDPDCDLIMVLSLCDLLTIVAEAGTVRDMCVPGGLGAFNDAKARIVALRNRVAHPARPLLSSGYGIRELTRDVKELVRLLDRARHIK